MTPVVSDEELLARNQLLIHAASDRVCDCVLCAAARRMITKERREFLAAATAVSSILALEPIDYEELDSGIRDVVRLMREAGFDTTDSGDGVSKPQDGMCVLDYPHVFATTSARTICDEAHRLCELLGPEWRVEVQYSPNDGQAILSAVKMDAVALYNAKASA